MPLLGSSNGGLEESGYIARRTWLYCRKSIIILPEEHGCIAGSVVIFLEDRGYIPGRARLYCRNFVMKIVAT